MPLGAQRESAQSERRHFTVAFETLKVETPSWTVRRRGKVSDYFALRIFKAIRASRFPLRTAAAGGEWASGRPAARVDQAAEWLNARRGPRAMAALGPFHHRTPISWSAIRSRRWPRRSRRRRGPRRFRGSSCPWWSSPSCRNGWNPAFLHQALVSRSPRGGADPAMAVEQANAVHAQQALRTRESPFPMRAPVWTKRARNFVRQDVLAQTTRRGPRAVVCLSEAHPECSACRLMSSASRTALGAPKRTQLIVARPTLRRGSPEKTASTAVRRPAPPCSCS
jgi:hypothetical protein